MVSPPTIDQRGCDRLSTETSWAMSPALRQSLWPGGCPVLTAGIWVMAQPGALPGVGGIMSVGFSHSEATGNQSIQERDGRHVSDSQCPGLAPGWSGEGLRVCTGVHLAASPGLARLQAPWTPAPKTFSGNCAE